MATSPVRTLLLCLTVLGLAAVEQAQTRPPTQAVVVRLERQQWQALAAAALAPAIAAIQPLIYDDGSEQRPVAIPHDALAIKDLGQDAVTATAAIATRFWTKAPTVYVVETYEQALWVIAAATLAQAPILVAPTADTLQALGAAEAVVLGVAQPAGVKIHALADKAAAWKHLAAVAKAQNAALDYVIVTNPTDTADALNPNLQDPYLSLATAPLAAFRKALVQTGDYTGDRKRLHAVGGSLGDAGDKAKYQFLLPLFRRIKDEGNQAAHFLLGQGAKPRFMAMVGGPVALPQYILDLHMKYTFWDIQIDYVPSDYPYGVLRTDTDFTRYVKPDLSVGRILGDSVQDACLMLAKTFYRKDWLPGGRYVASTARDWNRKAIVLDGHRLNQPDEGGPEASPDQPFFPAAEVQGVFADARLTADYVFPRDETRPAGPGNDRPLAPDLFAATSGYGFIQHVAHGDPPYLRIETGRKGKDLKNYLATGSEYRRRLQFQAPSVVYIIGCNVGTIYGPFKNQAEFLPQSAIHAGLAAYLAPNKCQAICFWRLAPQGPGADQCVQFWRNFLGKRLPLGPALDAAKWEAYQPWARKQAAADRGKDSDNAIEVDPPALLLFGDPALTLE